MNTIDLSFSSSFFSVFMHFLLLFLAPFHFLDMDIIGYVFICCCSFEISMAAFRLFRLLFLWFWTPPVHKFIGFHHDMGIGLCHPPCCVLFLKFIYLFLSLLLFSSASISYLDVWLLLGALFHHHIPTPLTFIPISYANDRHPRSHACARRSSPEPLQLGPASSAPATPFASVSSVVTAWSGEEHVIERPRREMRIDLGFRQLGPRWKAQVCEGNGCLGLTPWHLWTRAWVGALGPSLWWMFALGLLMKALGLGLNLEPRPKPMLKMEPLS